MIEELGEQLGTNGPNVTREPRAHDSGAKVPKEAPKLGSTDGKHRHQGVPIGNIIREFPWGTPSGSSDGEPRTSDGEYRWGTPNIIRENSGSIYTTDSASYRSASLS